VVEEAAGAVVPAQVVVAGAVVAAQVPAQVPVAPVFLHKAKL
jgi:hypothetical protein